MGKPRAKKKSTVIVSSDDEEEEGKAKVPNKASTTLKKPAVSAKEPKSGTPKAPRTRKETIANPASQNSQGSPSKAKERPIYSFFNAATQRQQSSTTVNSQLKKESVEAEEEDLIQDDDSFGEELANLSETKFGTKYPIAVRRKRKIHDVAGADTDSLGLPKGSQIFKRAAIEANGHSGPSKTLDLRPWTEKYGPVNLDELAVHKKKVQDVTSWLQNVLSGRDRKRLLILKGAAGSGKTMVVNLISQQLGLHINEWRAAAATSSEEGFVSMSAQFEDFVARTGTFGTLDFGSEEIPKPAANSAHLDSEKKELVLIEEFPNTFSRSSSGLQSFRTAVLHYLEATTPSMDALFTRQKQAARAVVPIIMIISESLLSTSTAASDSFTVYRLLGPEILGHTGATVYEFNPIAPTYMTKALDLIIQKESRKSGRRRAPGPSVLKHLAEIGDIRSAVSSLEFLCLRGDESSDWSGRVTFTKTKRGAEAPLSKMESESLEIITQRESTLGIFHAVGKVVYNKRELPSATDTPPPQPPPSMPQNARPKVSEVNIDMLLNELGTDISTFVAALHENYVLSCEGLDAEESLDHVNGCIDNLSDADILSPDRFSSQRHRHLNYSGTGTDSLRQDEISFQTSVRGILFSLPHPVKRIAHSGTNSKGKSFGSKSASFQMFYPASLRIWRREEETEELLDQVVSKLRDRLPSKSSTDGSKPSAVEAWRLNRFSGQPTPSSTLNSAKLGHPEDEAYDATNILIGGTTAKTEMLLERLPYMSLLRRCNRFPDLKDMAKDLEKITRMTGSNTFDTNEDGEGEGAQEGGEQWSTDTPAEEGLRKRASFGLKKELNPVTAAVKEKMESLVIEDDDIED